MSQRCPSLIGPADSPHAVLTLVVDLNVCTYIMVWRVASERDMLPHPLTLQICQPSGLPAFRAVSCQLAPAKTPALTLCVPLAEVPQQVKGGLSDLWSSTVPAALA